jgi:hypothetical protein
MWIETRRNRLTGELENTISGGFGQQPSDSALKLHLGTLEATWAYRKSEADFLLELLRVTSGKIIRP